LRDIPKEIVVFCNVLTRAEQCVFDHCAGVPYNEYAYDDIDRLAQANYLKGSLTENEVFTMDDLGNRTEVNLRSGSDETYVVADDTTYYYYNDNWQVFAEFDGDDDFQRWYVYGNYIDEVLLVSVLFMSYNK
jgi:hypothetical protein